MNRNDTEAILRIRLTKTGDNFGAAMLDEWHRSLQDVDTGAAVVAMRRACDSHAKVGWYQFKAELDAHLRNRRDTHTENDTIDCMLCGGTGWKDAGPDRRGNTSVEPCQSHMRPGKILTPAEGIAHAAAAVEDEMRRMGKTSADIDRVLGRWFGTGN